MTDNGEAFLKNRLTFDEMKLLRGHCVQILIPAMGLDDWDRTKDAIVKEVSAFKITLVTVDRDKVEEKEYPIEAFEGVNGYKLKSPFGEVVELKTILRSIADFEVRSDLDAAVQGMKELAQNAIK